MATLDRWRSFLHAPHTIDLVHAELVGRNGSEPLMIGTATIRMPSLQEFSYSMKPSKGDSLAFIRAMEHQRLNSYDPTARLRLSGRDAEGREWLCGWTVPRNVRFGRDPEIDGHLTALDVTDSQPGLDSTEFVYQTDHLHPLARVMGSLAGPGKPRFEKRCKVLNSVIDFTYDRKEGVVSICATHSDLLPITFTERWLGQPIRIIFGQPISPRLIARNRGRQNDAVVWIARVPRVEISSWSAFLIDEQATHPIGFFDAYCDLLRMIALDQEQKFAEAHPVTRYYDELAQVANTSRWLAALAVAGCTEGLEGRLRKLIPPDQMSRPVQKPPGTEQLVAEIEKLVAPISLKRKAIEALDPPNTASTTRTLRMLRDEGRISAEQFSAWQRMRNRVMHGEFISLFSNQSEDEQIMHLVAIVRALTREILLRT